MSSSKSYILIFLLLLCTASNSCAQIVKVPVAPDSIQNNWYVQVGMDMTLQNPCGYDFTEVFPNGKTFGVDLALGRWFSPEVGLRGRVNWENGIPLFENDHANWLAPFNKPGVNMQRGGYLSVSGDVQLDVHNILWGYKADRLWNLQLYTREGLVYNYGVSKGSPLIGVGIGNTFRFSPRLSAYLDVTYQAVSSGFTADRSTSTGTGTNSNGFLDLNLGVQVNLGKSGYRTVDSESEEPSMCESLSQGWFLEAGMDQTLMLAYNKPLRQTFTKGRMYGLDLGLGRWFSPDLALRARLAWDNGIPLFENPSLEWVGPSESPKDNMRHGGILLAYMDALVSVKAIFIGKPRDCRWDAYVFPRAGLGSNLAIHSLSPMVGLGFGGSYRLTPHLHAYADLGFQGITSEFFGGVSTTGMKVPTGFNSFLNTNLGVRYDL